MDSIWAAWDYVNEVTARRAFDAVVIVAIATYLLPPILRKSIRWISSQNTNLAMRSLRREALRYISTVANLSALSPIPYIVFKGVLLVILHLTTYFFGIILFVFMNSRVFPVTDLQSPYLAQFIIAFILLTVSIIYNNYLLSKFRYEANIIIRKDKNIWHIEKIVGKFKKSASDENIIRADTLLEMCISAKEYNWDHHAEKTVPKER